MAIKRAKQLKDELKRVTDIIIRGYRPKKIILFGSVARNKINQSSDVDLAIIKNSKKRFTDRIGDVINLTKPRVAVDFIVYTPSEFAMLSACEPFVKEEIVKNGKVIYESGK